MNIWIPAAVAATTGIVIGWLAASVRGASSRGRAAEAARQAEELKEEVDLLRQRLRAADVAAAEAQATAEADRRALVEQRSLLEDAKVKLADSFRALASEALSANERRFLTLAEEKFRALKDEGAVDLDARRKAFESLLAPLAETLSAYQKESKELEEKRLREISGVGEQIRGLAAAQISLQAETTKLATALRSPQARGQWGEIALHKTAELAGMSPYCDFFEQESVDTADGRLRPDMIVRLPAGREVVVDSKVPLAAFLDAVDAPTDEARAAALARHAAQVRQHVLRLSAKDYQAQYESAEFVVLFIPNDSFLAAAAEQDPGIIEFALQKNVVIATPTTFIALLRAVAYGWRQEQIGENAEKIRLLGAELCDRLGTVVEHFGKVGSSIGSAVKQYNAAVASFESRLLPAVRRFQGLGISGKKELPELAQVEEAPRSVPALEEPGDVEAGPA